MSSQDEFSHIDKAFEAKLSSRACPVCARGQFEPLRADFIVRPRQTPGAEPIEAVGQICVRCGFIALHSSEYLLAESP